MGMNKPWEDRGLGSKQRRGTEVFPGQDRNGKNMGCLDTALGS